MRVPTVPLVAACALLLFIAVQRLRKAQHEADTLRRSNAYLKDELELLRLNHESGPAQLARTTPAAVECPKPAPCPTASFAAAPTTTASTSSSDLSAALLEARANLHRSRLSRFIPLTLRHTIRTSCAELLALGGPDLLDASLRILDEEVIIPTDAELVGTYGGHSDISRAAARAYDASGRVTDGSGAAAPSLQ